MKNENFEHEHRMSRWVTPKRLIIAFVAIYAVVQLILLPGSPVIESDSGSYLSFSPIRSAGYPLFLQLFGPGSDGVMIAQLFGYAAAVGVLGLEVLGASGRPVVAGGMIVSIMINPDLNKYHSHIMTESLFATLLCLFLAALVRFSRQPGWQPAAVAAVMAGLAATVRPNGYALLPVLVLLVLMTRHRLISWRVVMIAAVAPMLILIGAERHYAASVHGTKSTSLAGRHFFAKAAMIDAQAAPEETDPVRQRLITALETDLAPIRALVAAAPDANIRSVLTVNYETCAEYACTAGMRTDIGLSESVMNTEALRVGLARLARAPLGYAELVWRHYRAMWVLYPQSHPDLAPAFVQFIASQRPLPFESLMTTLTADIVTADRAIVIRPAVVAIGGVTAILALLGLVAAVRGRMAGGSMMVPGVLAALTVHGSLLLTALLGVGIPRYTVGLWPAMMVALAAMVAVALDRLRSGVRP